MRIPLFLTSVVLASAVIVSAQDEPEPIIEDEGEDARIDGVVFLSSGERLHGKVSFTHGRSLRVYDVRTRRTYSLKLSRIETIRTLVEMESMEEAWAFEEEGSRKKIRLGWSYPLRSYRQEIQLSGGQVIEGHCHAAVLYVESGGKERKVILPRSQKGKKGEKLDDLVYPASIDLGPLRGRTSVGTRSARPFASLEGQLDGLDAITLVELQTARGYPGIVSSSGDYRVSGLLPGEYLVFLRVRHEITVGFPEADALSDSDLTELRTRIAGIAEFFNEKRILATAGTRREPWVLLQLERKGGTTLRGAGGKSYAFRRWELWAFRRTGSEWKVSRRTFLDRLAVPPGKALPATRLRRETRYERVKLGEGNSALP